MSHRLTGRRKCWSNDGGNLNNESDQRIGMVSRFRPRKLVAIGRGILATLVGVRRGSAFALQATIRGLATWLACSEAVKRPDQ